MSIYILTPFKFKINKLEHKLFASFDFLFQITRPKAFQRRSARNLTQKKERKTIKLSQFSRN